MIDNAGIFNLETLIGQFDQIIFHFDGNNNDHDDIAALPIAAAIANSAGIQDKTTFFYSNNLSEPNNSNQVRAMRESAAFAEQLGVETYDYQAGISQATNALVEILNSGEKVLGVEGGPMEAIYRALERVRPENRSNLTLISHSTWNEDRNVGSRPGGGTPRTWDDLRSDFPEVTLIDITDQNRGFNSDDWTWLDNTNDPVLQEARELMRNANRKVNDPSDAGSLFYAITGEESATPFDARAFFNQNPPTFESQPPNNPDPDPTPIPDPTPDPVPDPTPLPEPTPDPVPDPIPFPDENPPTSGRGLLSFALVNAETNEIVDGYENLGRNGRININGLDLEQYSLVAQVNPNHSQAGRVESVEFESSLGNRTENIVPYALFGDARGNYQGKTPTVGRYTVKATAFSQDGGQGEALGETELSYRIVDNPPVTNPPSVPSPVEPPRSGGKIYLGISEIILQPGESVQEIGEGVTIAGFDFDGSPADVVYDNRRDRGFGVSGTDDRFNQIDFDSESNRSESLQLTFDSLVGNVELIVGQLNANEGQAGLSETGKWTAFDEAGQEVGSGLIGPELSTLGDNVKVPGSYGQYPIAIDTDTPFASLTIEATSYGHGQGSENSFPLDNDSSDFNIAAVSFEPI